MTAWQWRDAGVPSWPRKRTRMGCACAAEASATAAARESAAREIMARFEPGDGTGGKGKEPRKQGCTNPSPTGSAGRRKFQAPSRRPGDFKRQEGSDVASDLAFVARSGGVPPDPRRESRKQVGIRIRLQAVGADGKIHAASPGMGGFASAANSPRCHARAAYLAGTVSTVTRARRPSRVFGPMPLTRSRSSTFA